MSLSKDLQNIREQGGASLAELGDFLAKMKGRSPQEVMGLVAGSGLFRATFHATILTVLFIAAFTVGPYFYYGPVKARETAAKPADKQAAPATTDTAKKPDSPATPAAPEATATAAATSKTDAEKAAKALGIDETKPADAKTNPLEKNLDNLLDNLK